MLLRILGLALWRVRLSWLLWAVLLLLWRRAGAGRWVVRHRSAAPMRVSADGVLPSRVPMPTLGGGFASGALAR